jgi:bifunctional UDP-N-acetylglucosamine pyrophosphorylase/glucosamine-1-phosphate N-acetyltransferase
VEVVRSNIGCGSKAKHLTYIGDADIETDVNIGAGTIVANYNGKDKNRTHIKKGAFIGSGSILIAPVKVGKEAITGAGAVVTKNRNVPDRSVVVGIPARVLKRVARNHRPLRRKF